MNNLLTSITADEFDGMPAWRIESADGARALIAERGATLISWEPFEGAEVIEGPSSSEELARVGFAPSRIMAPWCGSLEAGRYVYNRARYQLPGPLAVADGAGGLAYAYDFERTASDDALILSAMLDSDEGYPWPLHMRIMFALEAGEGRARHLSLTIEVTNMSEEAAPVSLGWMPCVRMPGRGGISNLSLRVPARAKILANRGIPLTGDAAYGGISFPERIDYIGTYVMCREYTELVPDDNGVVVTELADPARSARLVLTQEPSEASVVRLSTGEDCEVDRSALVLAPMSAVSNAFNRADWASRIRLDAGDTRSLTTTLTYMP